MSFAISEPSKDGKCGSCDGSNNASYPDDSSCSKDSDIISITSTVREKASKKTLMPLQAWVDFHRHKMSSCHDLSITAQLNLQRVGLLSRLKVAYAIGKLFQHIKASMSGYSQEELVQICCASNFAVHTNTIADGEGWEREVTGVDMISPPMSLKVISSFFDSENFFALADEEENLGRDTRVEVTKHSPFYYTKQPCQDSVDDKPICYALGVLMEFIFSEGSSMKSSVTGDDSELNAQMGDLLRALSISPRLMSCYSSYEPKQAHSHYDSRPAKSASMPSQSQGDGTLTHPAMGPILRLVRDLLSCPIGSDCSPPSLDAIVQDMYQLLLNPNKFLFKPKCQLIASSSNMFGRSAETRILLDAFCRVSNSGQSEAFVISGFSGKDKSGAKYNGIDRGSKWAHCPKKFEQNSTNQLALVLSAFDDLCALLANGDTNKEHLWRSILSEFGPCVHMLVQTIPNVIRLVPSPEAALSLAEQSIDTRGDVNFFSLCDIIKRFMRAIRSMPRPVMLFLDDLQWADAVSLGLVHTVLSDKKGASCLFFVGTYRDNEVPDSHILHGFRDWLSAFNVPYNTVHLDDMSEENVLRLVSDSLGMLPRLCQPLSQVVFHKTGGNPFFVQTFLRSLVDKRLLSYSLRARSWEWDIDEIYAENITPNVLYLLSSKMSRLSEKSQTALKVAACFGIKVNASIIKHLSGSEQYPNLLADINKAVDAGLMCSDADSSYWKFAHDKVRKAAYDLISPADRDKFHFDIGMTLLTRSEQKMVETEEEGSRDILLSILNQINHGVPMLLHGESQRISIAKLYHQAASQMQQCYNYTSAYELSKTGISLLPDDSWSSQYGLSLNLYLLLSKSAFSNRNIVEAKNALNNVISQVTSLQQKLDAYSLQCSILLSSCAPNEMGKLLITILAVLNSLGEYIPGDISPTHTEELVQSVTEKFDRESDDSLLSVDHICSEKHMAIMQAYSILLSLAYVAKPKFHPYFAARWAQYTLQHKRSSKYTPTAYGTMAVVLCKDVSKKNVHCGHRIGSLSLRLLNNYDSAISELPLVHFLYYGHVGILFEPLQVSAEYSVDIDMLGRARKFLHLSTLLLQ